MTSAPNSKDTYIAAARDAANALPGWNVPWVARLRSQALERFADIGFPSPRQENWKYTNIAALERQLFSPAPPTQTASLALQQIEAVLIQDVAAHRIVFIDGRYMPTPGAGGGLPGGITVASLAATLERDAARLEPFLGRQATVSEHGFTALNAALLADGAFVHLAKDVVAEQPIYLVFITTAHGAPVMTAPRTVIVAESGSQATVIEHYVALTDAAYLTNAVTEVVAAPGARVEHYRVQQESTKAFHVGGLHVHQERDSVFSAYGADLGGLLVRNDVQVTLDAEGAACELNGLYIVDGRRHVDNCTFVDHARPRGSSREYYKGILDGRGRAVFNGRVRVRPDAQHTDARQMNKNLLLSKDAEVDTKPQLEIYADDVKCGHGATVGQLDANALFYLRSRAIDEVAARDLLTYAFAHDVLNRFKLAPVRSQLERKLTTRLLHGRSVEELELI